MRKNKAKFKADGIAIWMWLHENPLKRKEDLPERLKFIANKYFNMSPFCGYYDNCESCVFGEKPWEKRSSFYLLWDSARTIKQSQKYSGLILKAFRKW